MDKYSIPNVVRTCRVLGLLAGERGSLTASEVARRLAAPRTTVFRILRTLCGEGMVAKSSGGYRVGPGLLRLGVQASDSAQVPAVAEPVLRALADATGETAHLAVPAGDRMLILRVCDSPNPIRVASRPGTLVHLHCAATGKAYLGALPPAKARDLLARIPMIERTSRTLTTPAAMERELETVRRQGYALDDGEYHEGVRCLAASILDARGEVVAAVGITAAAARFAKRRIPAVAQDVTGAAAAISAALGRAPNRLDKAVDGQLPKSKGNRP